eukprot:tig00020675_g12654.t1
MTADSSSAAKRRAKAKARKKQQQSDEPDAAGRAGPPPAGAPQADARRNARVPKHRRAGKTAGGADGRGDDAAAEQWQRMSTEERRAFVEKECLLDLGDAAARVCELTNLRDDWSRFFLKSALASGFAPETRPTCPHPSLVARLLKIHVVGRSIVYHTEDVYISTDFEVEPPAEDAHEFSPGYHIELEAEESGSEGTEGGDGEDGAGPSSVLMAGSCVYFLSKNKDPVLNLNTAGRADDGVEAFSLRFTVSPHMDACGAWLPFQDMPPGGRVFLTWNFTDREVVAVMEGKSGRVVAGPKVASADRSEGVIDCVGLGDKPDQARVMVRADWLLAQWGLPLAPPPGPRPCRHPAAAAAGRQACGLCTHFAFGAPQGRAAVALRYAGPGERRIGLEAATPEALGECFGALAEALPEEGPLDPLMELLDGTLLAPPRPAPPCPARPPPTRPDPSFFYNGCLKKGAELFNRTALSRDLLGLRLS